jgi:hypothetical protein
VGFQLFGDASDFQSWVEVFLNGTRVNFNDATFGWTITSPSGPIGNIARPITDAVLTFTNPQTGTVQIVGARRPRRTSQFQENSGVPTRNFNVVISDLTAQNREVWDKINDVTGRALISQPGVTLGMLPQPSACAGGFLGFDATGLIPQCLPGGAGSGNVVGPASSTVGHFAIFNNTTGELLADHVIQGSDLPAPGASSLGGVESISCAAHQWLNTISIAGVPACAPPAITDISGFGSGVVTALGFAPNTSGGLATSVSPNFTGTSTYPGSTSGMVSVLPNAIAETSTVHWPENSGEIVAEVTPQFEGGSCNGSVDNTTAINNAIAALPSSGGIVRFPRDGICAASGTITISSKPNVKFVGSGSVGANSGPTSPSQLQYTGTGARFIDARDSFGFGIEGMVINYSSPSFTGFLVDLGSAIGNVSAFSRIRNNAIGTSSGRTGTATLININASVDAAIEYNYFFHGFPAIQGQTTFSLNTVTKIHKNTFTFNDAATAIQDCGEAWEVTGNSFEPTTGGLAGAFANSSSVFCVGGVWNDNWFGDATSAGGAWIDGFFLGTQFSGNRMLGDPANGTTGVKFEAGSVGVSFTGNLLDTLGTGINFVGVVTGSQFAGNSLSGPE